MFAWIFCRLNLHRPEMRFHWVRGRRVVHCGDCGCEMIERSRGRWRPSVPDDHRRY